ncbi:MAG: DUF4292 domain-containing protein [Bacteroidota bacterium]
MSNNKVRCVVLVFIVFLAGCKTKEKIGEIVPVLPLRDSQLVRKVKNARPHKDEIFFKRTVVKLDSERENRRFKANIWLKTDSFLRMSVIGPMGMEAARINFLPEEVVIIDRMNRVVVYSGYQDVKKRFGLDIDFRILQNLFLNRGFSYFDGNDLVDYHGGIENRQYKLASIKEKEYQRKLENPSSGVPVFHRLWFDSKRFYLTRTSFSNAEDIDVDVNYNDFKSFEEGFYFPEAMSIEGQHQGSHFSLNFEFGDIHFDGENSISFRIPDQYEKILR